MQWGWIYEVESFDGDSDNGLFVKGILEGLDPAAFALAQSAAAARSIRTRDDDRA